MIPKLVLTPEEQQWIVDNATKDGWLFDCPRPLVEKLCRTGNGRQKTRLPGQVGIMLCDPLWSQLEGIRLSQLLGTEMVVCTGSTGGTTRVYPRHTQRV